MIGDLLDFLHTEWGLVPESLSDLSKLKDTGEYTEETVEENNRIIKRVHYKSFDGKTEIHREVTTSKNAEKWQRLSELNTQINRLLKVGRFEEAIPLRDELRQLQSELKPTKTIEGQEGKKKLK